MFVCDVHIINMSLLKHPANNYYGSVDLKISFSATKYFFINNVSICTDSTGCYYINFPKDYRSCLRNHSCIVPSKELRQIITDEVLLNFYKSERMNKSGKSTYQQDKSDGKIGTEGS